MSRAKSRVYSKRSGPEIQYHQGGGGVDEILRPTLLSVGEGSCYRLVKDSWPWEVKGEEFGKEGVPIPTLHTSLPSTCDVTYLT